MVAGVTEIRMTGGAVALVDDADADSVLAAGRWHPRPSGRTVYAQRHILRPDGVRTTEPLHRFLTGWPYVDHINQDGLDNRRANLRQATHRQNTQNTRGRDGTSRYKGVSAKGRFWLAQIRFNGKNHFLGNYRAEEDAARAYDAAAREEFGEFAYLNFPDEPLAAPSRNPRRQSSSFLGVSIYRRIARWRAYIRVDGKQQHIGHFRTEEEAAHAYDRTALEIFGPTAEVNFPQESR